MEIEDKLKKGMYVMSLHGTYQSLYADLKKDLITQTLKLEEANALNRKMKAINSSLVSTKEEIDKVFLYNQELEKKNKYLFNALKIIYHSFQDRVGLRKGQMEAVESVDSVMEALGYKKD
jgi:hypothetical protein